MNFPKSIEVNNYTFTRVYQNHSIKYILRDFQTSDSTMILKLLGLRYSSDIYIEIGEAHVIPENITVSIDSRQVPYNLKCDLTLVLI